ncbi:class I SAM-dependent methyltransferase [Paenibacillus thalictri]|uniref:Class I SAM-dependent methyltransferase n=1 Tax=Paenibacillus thalictri TaxID=2527873 RepID=A0A4Q9DTM0_9BACL|nr:class I SAM-dependent methyltransferase [Paenibacillus thalictri]TBL79686.1 class I SAM-dependent methyltransferase [Paenibacillus thalictri]
MPIDFHHESNRQSYSQRKADSGWGTWLEQHVSVHGKKVLDIGCGGGIYSRNLSEMGASSVTGVDFSEQMLAAAAAYCTGFDNIHFQQGSALHTGQPGGLSDVVLERALIHHIGAPDLTSCFAEAYRLLADGGVFVVQDRTPDDCLLAGSREHVRGYLFEKYPRLIDAEIVRRHSDERVRFSLQEAGFARVDRFPLWETRRRYADFGELKADLLARTGRSILHELSDAELAELCDYIKHHAAWAEGEPIEEKDRWTVWIAKKADHR